MTQVINESADAAAAQQSPGYLVTPFGWGGRAAGGHAGSRSLSQCGLYALQ
jgi:hypothetical protein